MKIIEPTHKEIMKFLDCCYYGYFHKGICECHNPVQFKSCYESAKIQLTRVEYTEEEIAKMVEKNAKAMKQIDLAISELCEL